MDSTQMLSIKCKRNVLEISIELVHNALLEANVPTMMLHLLLAQMENIVSLDLLNALNVQLGFTARLQVQSQ
jgi:hypothetical protein